MWPFSGENDGEHIPNPPAEEVLIAGGESMHTFTAATPLSQREAVKISDDYTVSRCDSMDEFYGIVPYDVGEGDSVPIIQAPALVRVRATGPVEPNSGVALVDSLTWQKDDTQRNTAIVHAYNEQNCMIELELRPAGRVVGV